MQNQEQKIIHIDWDGPHTFKDLVSLNDINDKGVYQIYGYHPIYGNNVLLYIGKTENQTFAKRINQSRWDETMNDEANTYYVGRLAGSSTPSSKEWKMDIDLAESLLIFSHKPAMNSSKLKKDLKADLFNLHILNWGNFNRLLPEVSGLRWTKKFNVIPNYEVYGDHD